jgi:hypothetical protein
MNNKENFVNYVHVIKDQKTSYKLNSVQNHSHVGSLGTGLNSSFFDKASHSS